MNITPKPPEVLQAQIATYTAEGIEQTDDSAHMFSTLGDLAVKEVGEVTRVTSKPEYHKGDDGQRNVRVPENTERTVATPADYTSFLRAVGGSSYESVRGRVEMLQAYEQFKPIISVLKEETADPATRGDHAEYMGSGLGSQVFKVKSGDNIYAVRVPRGKGTSPGQVDSHLAGAVLGRGIPHLEQIVAASYEDGVTVAEIMPGKEMGDLTVEEIRQVTDEQLSELVDTLIAGSGRGINFDPKPSNLLYDPQAGYGIVDYHSSKVLGSGSAGQDAGTVAGWFAASIANAGFYGKPYRSDKTAEDYARDLEYWKVNLDVLTRYRNVVTQKLSGQLLENALQGIDERIKSDREAIELYSNPHYVAEIVASNKEVNRREAEEREAAKGKRPRDVIELDFV